MKNRSRLLKPIPLLFATLLCQGASFNALADGRDQHCQLLIAKQLFDGVNFPQANMAVLIEGDKVKQVGSPHQLQRLCRNRINLGDATILPGFIESHAHITFQDVRKDTVLEHGITTAQDTGGPLLKTKGGHGKLRLLSVGPIIQAAAGTDPDADNPDATGYPLNIFSAGDPANTPPIPPDLVGGYDKIGIAVSSEDEAETVVKNLVKGGATAIKIALEPGGETGAPWMMPHGGHDAPKAPWPMLSEDIVRVIVKTAHDLDRRVIAHVGEQKGFDRALAGGVDELAHMPCAHISDESLQKAVNDGITFVTTIDTLASCGETLHYNAFRLGMKGAKFIYGSEVAHDNVPWGINGEELHMMLYLTHGDDEIGFPDVVNVLKAATSEAGEHLDIPGLHDLGKLTPGAPADIIAVRGNPFQKFKILEYPDLVMSGGHIVVNKFSKHN